MKRTQIGRATLYTDVEAITYDNVIPVLKKAIIEYRPTIAMIDYLLNYEAGKQPLRRTKTYRPDINCECVDNIANEITEFKLGFNWGSPITLVQRGAKDSGGSTEAEAISLLNECYEAEGIRKKTQELARFIEICGIGYSYVEINKGYTDGESYFKIETLDPRCAFVVRSSYYIDNRVMLGVTFRVDDDNNYHFTCFSDKARYEIVTVTDTTGSPYRQKADTLYRHAYRSGEVNPLGRVPITEYIRAHDRMGCFERQISEMDNLNLLISDFTNDVEQNTQTIWHANDIDFGKDENGEPIKPKTNEWAFTFTTQDGKTPFINPLAVQYDYTGMLNNIQTARSRILEKCNVPSRNSTSGGSTGVAMDSATGYTAAETAAQKEQDIIESCKMEEVKSALAAIKASTDVPPDSPLLTLRYMDIQPSIKRNKNYELTTKINFFATAVSHGIYGLHALKAMDAFEDINQVWEDSRDLITAYQMSVFKTDTGSEAVGGEGEPMPNADRLQQDLSDQITNSPLIDGTSTGNE